MGAILSTNANASASAAAAATPILILGNHRSGTTWLYQCLAETGAFSCLTARHIVERLPTPPQEASSSSLRRLTEGGLQRCGDRLPVTPDLPEEYGYVLANGLGDSRLTPRTLPLFLALYQDLWAEGGGERPVLLKNPWDYGSFLSVAALLPRARIVFIHRHPLRVIHSSMRMLGELWARQDPYTDLISLRYRRMWARRGVRWLMQRLSGGGTGGRALLAQLIAGGVFAADGRYAQGIGRLPAHRWIALRYEDLCARPDAEVSRILAFLALQPLHPERPQTPPRVRPEGEGTLLPAVARLRLPRRLQPYLALHGYGALPA